VSLYYIEDEDDEETCLSFEGDVTLNHCGFYSQWEMYYHCFSLYPVDTITIAEDKKSSKLQIGAGASTKNLQKVSETSVKDTELASNARMTGPTATH